MHQARPFVAALSSACLIAFIPAAFGHGEGGHGKPKAVDYSKAEEMPFGRAGNPKNAGRAVRVAMNDKMQFVAMKELKEHAELMRKFPNMEHDEPYMAHISPGKVGEMVWQFTQPGEFYYACLMPGHMEAGMVSKIIVK